MVQSSHRVRRPEQKYTQPLTTLKNYQKATGNVRHKECQEPKILNVTRKQNKKHMRRSPEFNRGTSSSKCTPDNSVYNSRQTNTTDKDQQNLFTQAN